MSKQDCLGFSGLQWVLLLVCLTPSHLRAAFITTDPVGLTAVYSQASFGANPIEIEFNPALTISDPSLLNVDSEAKLIQLFNDSSLAAAPTINLVFVDTIDFCDGVVPATVGCATIDNNFIVVESTFAGGGFGVELVAHEIGHNLGLEHVGGLNLMNGVLNGNTDLTAAQASSALASPLVQVDGGNPDRRFISITPLLVTDAPEPSALAALSSLVFFGLFLAARRQRRGDRVFPR